MVTLSKINGVSPIAINCNYMGKWDNDSLLNNICVHTYSVAALRIASGQNCRCAI